MVSRCAWACVRCPHRSCRYRHLRDHFGCTSAVECLARGGPESSCWIILLLVLWPASLIYVFTVRDELRSAPLSEIRSTHGSKSSTAPASIRNSPMVDEAALKKASVLPCGECGFTSNERLATLCRNCGSDNLIGR
jgi:hypothetical protein